MPRHIDLDEDFVVSNARGGGKKTKAPKPPVVPPVARTEPRKGKLPASAVECEGRGMTPADKVFARLVWDDRFDPAVIEVGYEDRFAGVLFMPLLKFRAREDDIAIPFHRVRQFRIHGHSVWDRDAKLDILDSADLGQLAAAPVVTPALATVTEPEAWIKSKSKRQENAAAVAAAQAGEECVAEVRNATPVAPFLHYPGQRPRVFAPGSAEAVRATAALCDVSPVKAAAAGLRVCNFNVLHSLFEEDGQFHTQQRLPLIARELEAVEADVIFLQEVTKDFFASLRAASPTLVARYYWTSPVTDVSTAQATLSRYPITQALSFATSRNKRCLFADVSVPLAVEQDREWSTVFVTVRTANVHLLSDFGDDPVTKRKAQLAMVLDIIATYPLVLVAGDFNWGDDNVEARSRVADGFVDAWLQCWERSPAGAAGRAELPRRPVAEPGKTPPTPHPVGGFTFDPDRNDLARMGCRHHFYPRRLDKLLMRGITCSAAQLFADAQHDVVLPDGAEIPLFPSDHFGLWANVRADPSAIAAVCAMSTAAPVQEHAVGTSKAAVVPVPSGAACKSMPEEVMAVARGINARGSSCFKTALVIMIPEEHHAAINTLRAGYDKAYPRWMPHVTLMFPFLPVPLLPEVVDLLQSAFAAASAAGTLPAPFRMRLSKASHFGDIQNKNVYFFEPECDDGGAAMQELWSLSRTLFPLCRRRDAFVPHVTLGQAARQQLLPRLQEINAVWAPIEFSVSQMHLIAHYDGRPGYEVVHAFNLASESSGGVPTTPAVTVSMDTIEKAKATVLEDPTVGRKRLSPYVPADALEQWLAQNTSSDSGLVRRVPTHVSQLGGMYHAPSDAGSLDQFLTAWQQSRVAAVTSDLVPVLHEAAPSHGSEQNVWRPVSGPARRGPQPTPFYVEEERGGTFRLYLDVDIVRTTPDPLGGAGCTDLCGDLCAAVGQLLGAPDTTAVVTACFGPWVPAADEAEPPQGRCHGAVRGSEVPTLRQGAVPKWKLGLRLYFQRIFVSQAAYWTLLRRLPGKLALLGAALPDHVVADHDPAPVPVPQADAAEATRRWAEIVDAKAAGWDRARLLGTVKRRRGVGRPHGLAFCVSAQGVDAGLFAQLSNSAEPRALLFATMVRVWDAVPAGIATANEFAPQHLFTRVLGFNGEERPDADE